MHQPLTGLTSIHHKFLARELPQKVAMIGTGNFLRAFVGSFVEEMNASQGFNGGICMIQPTPKGKVEALARQGFLYTVLSRGARGDEHMQVVRSVVGGIDPYRNYASFLALGELEELEYIISNTTEAGLSLDEKDTDMEQVPRSFPAKLCALLYRRYCTQGQRSAHLKILPCELLPDNGKLLEKLVVQAAENYGLGDAFTSWLQEHVQFYNTLVDRIVPGFPGDEYEELHKKMGYADNFLVAAEAFSFWAIESKEALFPPVKTGQLVYTDDLSYYRQRKVQLLNAAHTAMVPLALLNGLATVQAFVTHPSWGEFFRKLVYQELSVGLRPEDEDLLWYTRSVIKRFENPYVQHYFKDIALNTTSKIQARLVPVLLSFYAEYGEWPPQLCQSLAAYMKLFRESALIEVPATAKAALQGKEGHALVETALAQKEIFGKELTDQPGLAAAIAPYIR